MAACLPAESATDGGAADGDAVGASASDVGSSSGAVDVTTDAADAASALDATQTGSSSGSGGDSGGGSAEAGPSSPGPSSCQVAGPGRTDCGGGSESCCTSLDVPGGTYYRTYLNTGSGPTMESDPATVSDFRLDKYLVTVGRFREFVAAYNAGWMPPPGSGKHTHLNGGRGLVEPDVEAGLSYEPGWLAADDANLAPTTANLHDSCDSTNALGPFATWTDTAGSQENLPINCVNWYEAEAFCIWDGAFLPSEAEWEYAAAGGAEDRQFPWGSTMPGTACPGTGCEYLIYNCFYPDGPQAPDSGPLQGVMLCQGLQHIAPVGTPTLGAARWGQLDMAGEVGEWVFDWVPYFARGGANLPYANPCSDCAYVNQDPNGGAGRGLRGGNFSDSYDTNPWDRTFVMTTARFAVDGFRCARAP